MIVLNSNGKFCIKKLTDPEIGRARNSHQTHIGLNEDIIPFGPQEPVEIEGYLVFGDTVENCQFMFRYIEKSRSPLLQTNSANSKNSAYKRILDIVSSSATGLFEDQLDWYILLTFLYNDKPLLLLFNNTSSDYQQLNAQNAIIPRMKNFGAGDSQFYAYTKLLSSKIQLNQSLKDQVIADNLNSDLLLVEQSNQRAFVHHTFDFLRLYEDLSKILVFKSVSETGYYKFYKEDAFNLKFMFICCSQQDVKKRNTSTGHVRWYEDPFLLGSDNCYLAVDWYSGPKKETGVNNDLMIPHFAKLLNLSYNYKYRVLFNIEEGAYQLWIKSDKSMKKNKIVDYSKFVKEMPVQEIAYGAPGTGKSFGYLEEEKKGNIDFSRITFHPDTEYASFVGCYKPVMNPQSSKIEYSFVIQPFLQVYIKAWKNPSQKFGLIIEEINRGNCANIFGDIFQLLDRDEKGFSKYPIVVDEDMERILEERLPLNYTEFIDDYYKNVNVGKIRMALPPNFSIYATMNTSDQSLFPIDSAFKRRWDWKYIKISEAYEKDSHGNYKLNNGQKVPLGWKISGDITEDDGSTTHFEQDWWEFVCKINQIINEFTESADKQLGYFFCQANGSVISLEKFVNKVVFYLWTDVFKDYGFDNKDLFGYEINEEGKLKKLTMNFPDFFSKDGDINGTITKKFIENVINWKKTTNN